MFTGLEEKLTVSSSPEGNLPIKNEELLTADISDDKFLDVTKRNVKAADIAEKFTNTNAQNKKLKRSATQSEVKPALISVRNSKYRELPKRRKGFLMRSQSKPQSQAVRYINLSRDAIFHPIYAVLSYIILERETYTLLTPLEYEFVDNMLYCPSLDYSAYGEREDAIQDLHSYVISNFQILWNKPSREKSAEEKELWNNLRQFIDLNEYLVRNPLPQTIKARIIKKDFDKILLAEFEDDESPEYYSIDGFQELFDLLDENDRFEGEYVKFNPDHIVWKSVRKINPEEYDGFDLEKFLTEVDDDSDFSANYIE